MAERPGAVTMKGSPLTLVGPVISVGDAAPDFEALNNDFQPVRLSQFKGKTVILSSVPSLTRRCAAWKPGVSIGKRQSWVTTWSC